MASLNRKSRRYPGQTIVKKKPSLDFSVTGMIYVSMMLFMGLAAINSQANLLFGVFGLMIGIMLVSWFVGRTVLRKLDLRRVFPEYVVVGQPASVQYEFTNRKRYWPSFSVTVGELSGSESFAKQPQAYLLHAAAGTTASVPMQVLPKRRGMVNLDRFQLSTSFPFGFIKRAADRRQADTIVIYPPIGEVDQKLIAQCLSAERSGARMKPRRGGNDEFFGVKEFRTGENPRFIYWKRSARTGTLVSKEMTQVAPPRILILVDTYLSQRSMADHAEVERTIAMAASVISRTIDQGLPVGLLTWAEDWVHVPPTRGKRHSHQLLTVLARLPLNQTRRRLDLLEQAQRLIQTGTTPMLITPAAVEQSFAEQARGNWVVLSSRSDQTRAFFRFAPDIKFDECIPPGQVPAKD